MLVLLQLHCPTRTATTGSRPEAGQCRLVLAVSSRRSGHGDYRKQASLTRPCFRAGFLMLSAAAAAAEEEEEGEKKRVEKERPLLICNQLNQQTLLFFSFLFFLKKAAIRPWLETLPASVLKRDFFPLCCY